MTARVKAGRLASASIDYTKLTKKIPPTIVWLRRDLRIGDNPALHHAAKSDKPVLIIYIDQLKPGDLWSMGAASMWWLHHSLKSLAADLKLIGGRLRIFQGDPKAIVTKLITETGADTVLWNRRYEPDAIAKDKLLKTHLSGKKIDVRSFPGNLCHEPWTVKRQENHPYKVFTAYWRASLKHESLKVTTTPGKLKSYRGKLSAETTLKELKLLPSRDWATRFTTVWAPGESSAKKMLAALIKRKLANYQTNRDIPSVEGTSRLSAHLAFGEISPRQVHAEVQRALVNKKIAADDNTETFLREIGWREFAVHLLYHFPHTTDEPLDPRFNKMPWSKVVKKDLHRWQQGNTGIPLVDAGMRQLWQTGWMHNRVRMVAGSFLIKNMGYHWLEGARWFWDTLVDADLASNTMGWQWVAGSGADAAPYFRVFNPVRQGERFDPGGDYIREWVPEISGLSNKTIHAPWTASSEELNAASIILGQNYPLPIVELSTSRLDALARFQQIKQAAR